jgi:hypothetical protein
VKIRFLNSRLLASNRGSKRLSLIPCLVFLANLSVAAPRIECETPIYDFGTVTNQSKIVHEFTIWNRGDSPLTITKVRACCGMEASMDAMELAPNTSSVCRAVFDLSRRGGEQNKKIYLASNDPKQPYLALSLTGTHIRPSGILPKKAADSNKTPIQTIPESIIVLSGQEEPLQRQVMLTDRDGTSFDILSAKLLNASGTVDFLQLRPDRWRCDLSILPASTKSNAVLRIITSNKNQPEINVPLVIR